MSEFMGDITKDIKKVLIEAINSEELKAKANILLIEAGGVFTHFLVSVLCIAATKGIEKLNQKLRNN